jgi:S-formylglutathione hydrolase FrmB
MILRGNVYSESLNMHTGLSVLVPNSGTTKGPYRIVYLLHGLHGNHDTWLDNTTLPVFARDYNAVFIMPEAGRSFYTDMHWGLKYFTYISEELPEICRETFNISGRREDTAVMGCSMGGYGALKIALSNPERYGFCGSISSACMFVKDILGRLRQDVSVWLNTGGDQAEPILRDFYAIFGDDLSYKAGNDILELVEKLAGAPAKPVIYAACGMGDGFREENLRFRDCMEKFDLDFTYEEWQGLHDWYFFDGALKKALEKWYHK